MEYQKETLYLFQRIGKERVIPDYPTFKISGIRLTAREMYYQSKTDTGDRIERDSPMLIDGYLEAYQEAPRWNMRFVSKAISDFIKRTGREVFISQVAYSTYLTQTNQWIPGYVGGEDTVGEWMEEYCTTIFILDIDGYKLAHYDFHEWLKRPMKRIWIKPELLKNK